MAFALRTSDDNFYASTTNATVSLSGVQAGDLIVAQVMWEDTDRSPTCSDGTSSLTGRTKRNNGNSRIQTFYLLASVATGSVTYTFNMGSSTNFVQPFVRCINLNGATATVGQEAGATGSGSSASSGNITTQNVNQCVVGGIEEITAATQSAWQINGVAYSDKIDTGVSYAAQSWARYPTATFTGAATANVSGGGTWAISIDEFYQSTVTNTKTVTATAVLQDTLTKTTTSTAVLQTTGLTKAVTTDAVLTTATATLEQEGYRWRLDDDDEINATWVTTQDNPITASAGDVRRIRIIINATNNPDPASFQLEFKIKTAGDETYKKVPVK